MFNRYKLILFTVLTACCVFFHACEDDAILDPQEGNENNNGSYGAIKITPPGEETILLNDEDRTVQPLPTVKNPEIY